MSWRRWLSGLILAGCGETETPGSTPSTDAATSATTADTGTTGMMSMMSTSSTGADAGSTSTGAAEEDGSDGADAGSSSTGASSGGPTPVCGDGHLDPGEICDDGFAANAQEANCLPNCVPAACGDGFVHAGVEECDDGNFDVTDGCDLGCGRTRRVFVTSATYQGDEFEGLWGADQRCRSLAAQADLPNFAGYMAWLSDSTTSPVERMHHGKGRYELVNGLLVAKNWNALVAGELVNPIKVTEQSETHEIPVWTGTNPDGSAAEGSNHCLDWTSSDFGSTEFWGVSTEVTVDWTLADVDLNPMDCGAQIALYCFEQD